MLRRSIDVVGQRFGRLLVLSQYRDKSSRAQVVLHCRCDCGTVKDVAYRHAKNGKTLSCGCLRAESSKSRFEKPPADLLGRRFGRLTVVSYAGRDSGHNNKHSWSARCDCGNSKIVVQKQLLNGGVRSCGCLRAEQSAKNIALIDRGAPGNENSRGIRSKSITYTSWSSMVSRCGNANNLVYHGRGIRVCDRWTSSYDAFVLDVGERPSKAFSIERINNEGNYEPGNVRWATRTEQARNRRSSRMITINGVTRCATEWCQINDINPKAANRRLYDLGWDEVEAVTVPTKKRYAA